MNANRAILASFLASCALITWRDFRNPDSNWPLPAPPPYRYIGAGVAFGLLAVFGDIASDRIAATLAVGLFIGLAFQTAQSYKKSDKGNKPAQ